MASVLVFPFRTGVSYFTGHAFVNAHWKTGTLARSRRVTVIVASVPLPWTNPENQSQRAREPAELAMPLLRTR